MGTEKFNKKADTGMSDFGQHGDDLSPNTHNEHTYYSNDCWSNDRDNEETEYKPGSTGAGDFALDNKNPAIMNNKNYGNSRHDKLEEEKLPYQPANTKKFDKEDLDTLNSSVSWSVASSSFTLTKRAYIQKVPNKNEYKVLSETGKTLGTYPTREKAEKRLKQIEMFKHMDKKADYFDWKGQQNTTEPLGTPEKVVPADDKRVKPYAVPEATTSSVNVPGMNQDDSSLACTEELDKEAKVVGDVKGKGVTPSVTDGSSGFSATRGGRGARAAIDFQFNVEAATRINTVPQDKLQHQDTPRNEQTPYNSDGKGTFSYSECEKKEIKKSPEFKNQKPINTAIPGNMMDRLYDVDSEKMVEGTEFGTWDFFITPTNQNVEQDVLTDEEKEKSKKRSTNHKF